jgi:hypothetical protein
MKRLLQWSPATTVLAGLILTLWLSTVVWSQSQNFPGVGGNTVIPVSSTYVLSINCPSGAINCYQIHADGQSVTDAVFTASSSTVTTPGTDPPFCNGTTLPCSTYLTARGHTTDVGTVYAGFFNCQANSEASCTYNCAQGTISAVNSAHSITISGTCTSNSSATANSNNFYWVSDDSTQLTAAFQAMSIAAKVLPSTLSLPCGLIGMGTSSFVDLSGGTRQWPIGMKGCGPGGATTIIPFPKMNCVGASGHGCLIFDTWSNNVLGVLGAADKFSDLTFWGGGLDEKDAAATYSADSGVFCNFFCELDNIYVTGWIWNHLPLSSPVYGIYCRACTMVASGSYAGGDPSCKAEGNSSVPATIIGGSCGASLGNALRIGAGQVTTTGVYFNATRSSSFVDPLQTGVYNNQGIWVDTGSFIAGMWNDTGGVSIINGSTINGQAQQFDVVLGGGELHLRNIKLVHNGNMTGGALYDEGGNPPGWFPSALTKSGGVIYGSASTTGTVITATKLILSAGWGASAAWTGLTGGTQLFQGTVTNTGAGQAANPTITYTFPVAFLDATNLICEMHQVGGTQAILATTEFLTPSSVTTTGAVFTYNGTPNVSSTEVFQGSCKIP